MKRLLSILITLTLLLGSAGALAARGDLAPIRRDLNGIDVNSVCVVGDTLYAQGWGGIMRYKLGDAQATEVTYERPESSDVRAMVADGDQLYAMLERWDENAPKAFIAKATIEGNECTFGEMLELDWSQMIIHESDYSYSRSYESPMVLDGRLYILAMPDYGMGSRDESIQVMSFSLEDGSCVEVPTDGKVLSLAPYKDGQMLYFSPEGAERWDAPTAVGTLDPATGTFTKAFSLDYQPYELYGLAYDAASDTVFYVTGGQLHAIKGLDPSTDTAITDMPLQNSSGAQRPGLMMDGGMYVFYNYETVLLRNTNPDERPARTLIIKSSYMEPDSTYFAYTAAHPDVSVVIDNKYIQSQEVTTALMNREESVDIYLLDASGPEIKAMKERGYVVEITDEGIREQMSRMYPFVQEALSANGKLIAVPQSQGWGGQVTSYNKQTLEKLNLTEADLPTTWVELVEFLERWDERFGADFPEITPLEPGSMARLRETLLSLIFSDYVVQMEAIGEVRIDSPLLREALKRLDDARLEAIQTEENEDGYSWSNDSVLFNTWGRIGIQDWRNEEEVHWPLSFVKGEQPYTSLSLQVYVLNPFSKNQDIAMDYLRTSLEQMNAPLRTTLCPDVNEPIRETYYQQNLRSYERSIEELKRQLEAAPEEDKQIYEEQLKDYQGWYEDYMANSWAATAEDIARYRALAERIIIPTYSGFGDQNSEEMRNLIQRYVDRQIPMEQFLSSVDQKMRMMQMEGY